MAHQRLRRYIVLIVLAFQISRLGLDPASRILWYQVIVEGKMPRSEILKMLRNSVVTSPIPSAVRGVAFVSDPLALRDRRL